MLEINVDYGGTQEYNFVRFVEFVKENNRLLMRTEDHSSYRFQRDLFEEFSGKTNNWSRETKRRRKRIMKEQGIYHILKERVDETIRNREREQLPLEEKFKLLLKELIRTKKPIPGNKEIKGQKIGYFYSRLKSAFKKGKGYDEYRKRWKKELKKAKVWFLFL